MTVFSIDFDPAERDPVWTDLALGRGPPGFLLHSLPDDIRAATLGRFQPGATDVVLSVRLDGGRIVVSATGNQP